MTHPKRTALEAILCAALAIVLMVMLVMDARAEELPPAEHPAFGLHHRYKMDVEADLPLPENPTPKEVAAAIKKAETRAVAILRRPDSGGLTLEEAQAKVRIDGKTDVRRCLEVIFEYQLRSVKQARVTAHLQEAEHPEAVGGPVNTENIVSPQ
jgi:hypothetical protein